MTRALDVSEFIGKRAFGRFHLKLVVLCCLVTFFDGLDLGSMSYTGPYIRDEMRLSGEALGLVFSAGIFGQILGALICTYIADRIGRRPVILVCAVLAALFTIAMGLCTTVTQLLVVRLMSGLTIGGLLPVAWALNIEAMPNARRSTVVAVIMLGFSLGTFVAAPLTNFIAPVHGWQWVYIVAGIGTLLVSLALVATLPESARFLVSRGAPAERIAPLLRQVDPQFDPAAYESYLSSDEKKAEGNFTPAELFRGSLKFITPLIWGAYFFGSVATFLGSLWGPIFFEELGMTRAGAAMLGSSAGLAGNILSVVLMRSTEALGPRWVALFPLLATPMFLLVGLGALGPLLLASTIFTGMVLKYGAQSSVISIIGTFYPSRIRANGSGWTTAVGKIGGVVGPMLGAFFVASAGGVLRAFLLLGTCTFLVGLCVLLLSRFAADTEETEHLPNPAAA